jgi:hypothetical protein
MKKLLVLSIVIPFILAGCGNILYYMTDHASCVRKCRGEVVTNQADCVKKCRGGIVANQGDCVKRCDEMFVSRPPE